MRLPRVLGSPDAPAVYHCISRTVGGQFLLDPTCRQKLVDILFRLADFCGLEVLTYCIMSNHFHLLIRVPKHAHIPDPELLRRSQALYSQDSPLPTLLRQQLSDSGRIDPDLRQRLLRRMGHLPVFMQEFKQWFTRWYNRRHERFGTLWSERFRSLLVQDTPQALRVVAAYIDLNPVRAGMVGDPKDYRFCGYHHALAGHPGVRRGLMHCLDAPDWEEASRAYREDLLGRLDPAGASPEHRQALGERLKAGEPLSLAEILRLRIRHLGAGVALGSRDFVEEVFIRYRKRFGSRRKSGARPIRKAPPLRPLACLRDLRVRAVE